MTSRVIKRAHIEEDLFGSVISLMCASLQFDLETLVNLSKISAKIHAAIHTSLPKHSLTCDLPRSYPKRGSRSLLPGHSWKWWQYLKDLSLGHERFISSTPCDLTLLPSGLVNLQMHNIHTTGPVLRGLSHLKSLIIAGFRGKIIDRADLSYIPPTLQELTLFDVSVTWGTDSINLKRLSMQRCHWLVNSSPLPKVSSQTTLIIDYNVAGIPDFWRLNEGVNSEIQTLELVGSERLKIGSNAPILFTHNVKHLRLIDYITRDFNAPNVQYVEIRDLAGSQSVKYKYPNALVWNRAPNFRTLDLLPESTAPPGWVHL